MAPDICPHCGAAVPPNAKACPECGSDETTGWSERADADNLGLPGEEFDYHQFVQAEFGVGRVKPRGVGWFWWVIALFVAILLSLALLSGMFHF